MINPSDYYDNKAFDLNEEKKNEILMILESYSLSLTSLGQEFGEQHRIILRQRDKFIDQLENEGIKVGYSWPGHRGKWFFPDYVDALMYEDWLWQCSD